MDLKKTIIVLGILWVVFLIGFIPVFDMTKGWLLEREISKGLKELYAEACGKEIDFKVDIRYEMIHSSWSAVSVDSSVRVNGEINGTVTLNLYRSDPWCGKEGRYVFDQNKEKFVSKKIIIMPTDANPEIFIFLAVLFFGGAAILIMYLIHKERK
jgi:hypothetical protein